MKQLVSPNLNVTGQSGWCLWYTQESYGVPHIYDTAWEAWLATQFKHETIDLPDVSVPVWFDYWENDIRYGHSAFYVPGQGVYSSPYNSYTSHAVLQSIEEVERIYGVTYVGWSEDISGVKIVEEDDMKATANDLKYLYLGVYAIDTPEDILAKDGFIGTDMGVATMKVLDYANKNNIAYWQYKPKAEKQIQDLQAQIKNLQNQPPKIITQEVEKIVTAGLEDMTFGQLLSEAFKKLFNIK